MRVAHHHAEWLSLVETSGPFLSMPVLMRAFPQGVERRNTVKASRLREGYADWLERGETQPAVHYAWIRQVLTEFLEYPQAFLGEGQTIPPGMEAVMANYGETLRPDFVLKHRDADKRPLLLIQHYSPGQDLEKPVTGKTWKASPGTRMMELLHGADVPLGLITNGEQWTLVYAPRGETTGFASWYADLWIQEPITLRAFQSLLHLRRFIGVAESDTLASLLAESATDQQEVTEQLGHQVRRAVEMLVQAFAAIEAEPEGRTLFARVSEKDLYNGALTVMMRLVFLFCAEERKLLLLGDPLYDQHYAISTLGEVLRERADQHGEEVLERRHDAWSRLLATFRVVHNGVEHEAMRLRPYGGKLFDPDAYPFLEGRPANTDWRITVANPLPINNRVVLHLLEALQFLRVPVPGGGPSEARRLSFRALGIEQIGHVYEGLLDHTVRRASEVVLGLAGSREAEPEIPLFKLEDFAGRSKEALIEYLKKETDRSAKTLKRLVEQPPAFDNHALLLACGHDTRLLECVKPFAGLIRKDDFGRFVVIQPGTVYVTRGSDRRSTGTHYTPRSLTEPIVQHTLEPLIYEGVGEGKTNEEWQLKSPGEILDLKICDMTMGSGAFLVQVCRYLSERLVEAWEMLERRNPGHILSTPEGDFCLGDPTERLIPQDPAERLVVAQRYVADRCIYGVDINPMAVEMAKLSLWLITMQRDRPFTFLDHALKCGDSLLGVSSLSHIENFSLRRGERQVTFATANMFRYVDEASKKRRELEALPSNDHMLVETKNRLHVESKTATAKVKAISDCLIAFEMLGLNGNVYDEQRTQAAELVQRLMQSDANSAIETSNPKSELARVARENLQGRNTFQWAVEFPEVFERGGFDAIVGNPPFLGGRNITSTKHLGKEYNNAICSIYESPGTSADLCSYFIRRAWQLIKPGGEFGCITVESIAAGPTGENGLSRIAHEGGSIRRAHTNVGWPGLPSRRVAIVHIAKRPVPWCTLNGGREESITPTLTASTGLNSPPKRLKANENRAFQGITVFGEAFIVTAQDFERLCAEDPKSQEVLTPYLTGAELNRLSSPRPSSYVIDFRERSEAEASLYYACFARLELSIKAMRQSVTSRKDVNEKWWRLQRVAPELELAAADCKRVICRTRYGSIHALSFVEKNGLFSDGVLTFAFDDIAAFAVLQSDIHFGWAEQYGSPRGGGLRYRIKSCFDTFPFPPVTASVCTTGETYYEHRQAMMLARRHGLTDIYNLFHNPSEQSADIAHLRVLHKETDQAVAAAYGWNHLDLGHSFHMTRQGERFTISESARNQVLELLLKLNHQRYAEEVDAGLHTKAAKTKSRRSTKALDATRETQQAELPGIPAESL